jgi:redox-sensitive bicupin YhaK (pirin superfamily)
MSNANTAALAMRQVERLVKGQATSDGDGVKLTRVLTQDLQQRLDPFLMLDNFASDNPDDYIGGFPNHPHRGFETVTYMIAGRMRHRDSAGHEGLLQNGGVQWMTAGFGLTHSELPEQEEGLMEGFQLWLNLPARDKLCQPGYRDIQSQDIPEWTAPGVTVRVIAGSTQGVNGAVLRDAQTHPTQALMLDVHLAPGASFEHALPAAHNAFVFVYRGQALVGHSTVPRSHMAILSNSGSAVRLQATGEAVRALLIAGAPLREPIVQYGPFVMNTREELMTAVEDFSNGKMG